MKVHLTVYGEFRKILGGKCFDIELTDGMTIRELLLRQGIPGQDLTYTMAILNEERKANLDDRLHHGDRLDVFQPVGGG